MTEPIFSSPTPLSQVPLQGIDQFEADPNFDGELQADPLLETGTFIGVDQNGGVKAASSLLKRLRSESASAETTTATVTEKTVTADATPLSQRPMNKAPLELGERPSWLPDDWKVEMRVRTSGATAGTTDRYFYSPSGDRLRSKKEVIHYLETGSKPKKKLKSEDGTSAPANPTPSGQKQKKPKTNLKDLSGLNYDFKNPPQSVDYSIVEQDKWIASVDNVTIPESQKANWDAVSLHVTQLDRSNGAS